MSTLIKNGLIIDGTGAPSFQADIILEEQFIQKITRNKKEQNKKFDLVIDAKNNYVTPGFIDAHSHSDLANLLPEGLRAKIMQGVTTEITGQCGLGVAPAPYDCQTQLREELVIGNPPLTWEWESPKQYYATLKRKKLESNMLPFIGHGIVRYAISQQLSKPLSQPQLVTMQQVLHSALSAGAGGLSFGLIYTPALFANQAELRAAIEVAAHFKTPIAIHLRSESDELIEALQEIIELCRPFACKPHISHLKAIGTKNQHLAKKALHIIEQEELTFDQYPYTYGSTTLFSILPPHLLQGHCLEERLAHLKKRTTQQEIQKIFDGRSKPPTGTAWDNLPLLIGWENIFIADLKSQKNRQWIGKHIAQIAEERKISPTECALNLLIEEKGAVRMIDHYTKEETVEQILTHPRGVIGSDTLLGGIPHPRVYGTFPRIIQRYVFQKKILTLEEAIAKMSGKTAKIMGIKDRGILAPGMAADIAIFSPDFRENATLERPDKEATGLQYLFINGKVKVDKEKYLTTRAGELIANLS